MCNIPTINDFEKGIETIKSLHTGKEQIASMSLIQKSIDMLAIDYSNANQKIHFINPQYGAEMIYVYNNFRQFHSHNVIIKILSASTDNFFYYKTLSEQFEFKNISHISFGEMDCGVETYDYIIRTTPGDTFDFVKGFDCLKQNGKILFSHLGEVIFNRKERTRDESEERIQLKTILNENTTDIIFIDGTTEYKSTFDSPVAIFAVCKNNRKNIKVLYNHINNQSEFLSVNSLNELWIHGNQIVSKIFNFLNTKTKTFPKIFDRLYNQLKKKNLHTQYKWWVRPNAFNGVLFSTNYYSFFSNRKLLKVDNFICKSENLKLYNDNRNFYFGFKTKKEAIYFVKLLQTKFMRFYLSMYKVDGNLNRNETRNLPEFDLSKEWTDKKIQRKLEIPKNYCTFINEFKFIQ